MQPSTQKSVHQPDLGRTGVPVAARLAGTYEAMKSAARTLQRPPRLCGRGARVRANEPAALSRHIRR